MADLGRGTGRWTRLWIGLQVTFVVLLAAACAGLATWLAGRPGLRWRVDATAAGRNTLDPTLAAIVERLPGRVDLEVFFRPVPGPWRDAVQEAQQRTSELLRVAANRHPDKLRLVEHDLRDLTRASQRLQELEVEGDNVVVVLRGEHKVVLRLERDLARFDPGNPLAKVEPRLEGFRGDEALGQALLSVSREGRPRILFSSGHGERDPFDTEVGGLGSLQSALAADGFDVGRWSSADDPSVPGDCDVLAIVAPRQPFSRAELDAVTAHVERGGRLFVVPASLADPQEGPGSVAELLRGLGIQLLPGFVAQLRPNAMGQLVEGQEDNKFLFVPAEGLDARHPVTETLRRLGVQLQNVAASRAFQRGTAPPGGRLDPLVQTSGDTWLDLPDARGRHDWRFERERERPGPLTLAMALEFAPRGLGAGAERPPAEAGVGELPREREVARVVAFGAVEAIGNGPFRYTRDFVLNAFNWLCERDWRLSVRPRDPDVRTLDVVNTDALAKIYRVAVLGLPGGVALLGLLVAWRRRR